MCGKNQAQIVGAMVAYAASEEVGFFPKYLPIDSQLMGATRGRYVTTKVFETLAQSMSLPSSLFRCPSSAIGGPNKQVKPDPSNSASTWGWGGNNGMTYAFDWATPADPSSSRAILTDRNPKAHGEGIMVTFGDAHVKKVKLIPTYSPILDALVTEGIDGNPVPAATAVAPDDDLFSAKGDAGDPLAEGKGDPLRAWVK